MKPRKCSFLETVFLAAVVGMSGLADAATSCVKASSFGFDPVDSTRFLQAAIDSGARTVVVDRQPTPWIVEPLKGRSNLELLFEKGVVVEAKRGSFLGRSDSLLSFVGSTNVVLRGPGATLRMHRWDYSRPPYAFSEWRHALKLMSVRDVRVEGLTFTESGGDGIYLGAAGRGRPCRDVTISGCVCSHNWRQGISVISVDGLLIENTVMRDTKGAPPEAGIDFEPNSEDEVLDRIVMRNCLSENNAGRGFELCFARFNATTRPVSIRLEDCRSVGDMDSFRLDNQRYSGSQYSPKGCVVARNCSFENARRAGISCAYKPVSSWSLLLENCSLTGSGVNAPDTPDILLVHLGDFNDPTDGIVMRNMVIRQPVKRPWINSDDLPENITAPVCAIRGDATVTAADGKTSRLVLDEAWCRETFTRKAVEPTLRKVPFSGAQEIVDMAPGEMAKLSTLAFRDIADCVFHAPRAGTFRFVGELMKVGKAEAHIYKPVVVKSVATGRKVGEFRLPEKEGAVSFAVKVPDAGFYTMSFRIGQRFKLNLTESVVPIAFVTDDFAVQLLSTVGDVWFYVPAGARFSFQPMGEGREWLAVDVFDPSGALAWQVDNLGTWGRFQPKNPAAGLWRATIRKPSKGYMDDYRIDLSGIPGVMFLSPKKYWK